MTEPDLERFVSGYIECAFWCCDEQQTARGEYYKLSAYPEHPELRFDLRMQAVRFFNDNEDTLHDLVYANGETRDYEHAGHDLWLTRNGHGCGFWETGRWINYEAASLLDAACKRSLPTDLYLNDAHEVCAWEG